MSINKSVDHYGNADELATQLVDHIVNGETTSNAASLYALDKLKIDPESDWSALFEADEKLEYSYYTLVSSFYKTLGALMIVKLDQLGRYDQ